MIHESWVPLIERPGQPHPPAWLVPCYNACGYVWRPQETHHAASGRTWRTFYVQPHSLHGAEWPEAAVLLQRLRTGALHAEGHPFVVCWQAIENYERLGREGELLQYRPAPQCPVFALAPPSPALAPFSLASLAAQAGSVGRIPSRALSALAVTLGFLFRGRDADGRHLIAAPAASPDRTDWESLTLPGLQLSTLRDVWAAARAENQRRQDGITRPAEGPLPGNHPACFAAAALAVHIELQAFLANLSRGENPRRTLLLQSPRDPGRAAFVPVEQLRELEPRIARHLVGTL